MSSVTRLSAQLVKLEREVAGFARSPQLAHSSLEDGFVDEYDRDGNISSRWGQQFDDSHGTYSLRGPVPPAPTAPIVTPILQGLRVAWDGFFAGDAIVPMDFSRVEVHVDDSPGFDPITAETLRATIETPRGADVIIALPGVTDPRYVKLVTRSLPGNSSAASEEVAGTPADPGEVIVVGTKIYYGPTTPVDPKLGELWYAEVSAGPPPVYESRRWDGDSWEPLADEGAANALAEAVAAAEVAALKGRLFAQTSAPANPPAAGQPNLALNDFWIDTDDGNRPYRWNGTSWFATRWGNNAIAPASLVASSVLVTGSITAALIAASQITADKMVAGTITAASAILATASVVDANIQSLTAAKITAGTMMADVVVGGRFATALTGQRVETTNAGIFSYDAGENLRVSIPATGGALFSGTITTALTGPRLVLEQGTVTGSVVGESVLRIFTGDPTESRPAEIAADISDVSPALSMFLFSPTISGQESKRAVLQLLSGTATDPSTIWLTANFVRTTGSTSVYLNSTVDANINAGNQPALKVGPENASHLRIDQGEIIAMLDDDTPGTIAINHSFASATPTRTFGGSGTVGDPQNKGDVVLGGLLQVLNNARAVGSGGSFGNRGVIRSHSGEYNCSIRFSEGPGPAFGGEVDIMIRNAATWGPVRASAFNVSSGRSVKEGFRDPDWSALEVLRNAPSKLWKYKKSYTPGEFLQMGPVADDLPAELVTSIAANEGEPLIKGVDLYTMIGLLWRVVFDLDESLDEVRAALKKPVPARKKAA
jgi:hypothetical protein